jgi:UDP-glucose 4-epimerase
VRVLAEQPSVDEVVVLDDLPTGFAGNLAGTDAMFVEGSILDEDLLTSTLHGASAVVRLAARRSVPRSIADPLVILASSFGPVTGWPSPCQRSARSARPEPPR